MPTLKSSSGSPLEYVTLKQRHRLVRDGHPNSLTLRIRLFAFEGVEKI